MIRFRKQFSLRTLLIVTCFLGINFAWVPWPGCAILAVVIVLLPFDDHLRRGRDVRLVGCSVEARSAS
jgi:hypothetical protein